MKLLTWPHPLLQCLLGLLISLCGSVSNAQGNEEITVVTELFDRYQLIDENNVLGGYSVEVINSLFEITGESPEIEIYPWSVAYQKALQAPNVMIFSMDRNAEREAKFHWVGRLNHEPIYFWSLKSINISEVYGLDSLKPFTVAVVKDANAHRYLVDRQFKNIYLMTSTFGNIGVGNRLRMLNGDRADIVIVSEHDVMSSIASAGLQEQDVIKVFHDPELDNDLYIALSRQTKLDTVKKYREAFKELKSSGKLTAIRKKWNIGQTQIVYGKDNN